jgi:outer membrane protein OmpA-like peptidoglycan-associated protein
MMSDESSKAQGKEPSEEKNTDMAMEEIRQLLLGPEQSQLRKLQERTEDPAFNVGIVSQVLPDAIRLRTRQDHQLTSSLLPTVEEAIALSAKRRPEVLALAIFPVLGPAIRKAIAAALHAMLTSLNQTLDHSLSPRALRWRMEALRTGRPFAEILLLRTLEYRVEQVFLIHRRTGLLLHHVFTTALVGPGADTISAMLTAIQDFVHDSFQASANEEVDALQVGELRVWVERGPQAVLAAVIRGEAPSELRTSLQETIETIHREYAVELERFDGDSAPFENCEDLLQGCLVSHFQAGSQNSSRTVGLVAVGALVVLALLLAFPLVHRYRWARYVHNLRAQPGIVVIENGRQNGKYQIVGLRDPLATDPYALLAQSKLKPQDVDERWEPYASSHPSFVLARARNLLPAPETVALRVEAGVLFASGSAPLQWIETARERFRSLGGINRYDDTALSATDSGSLAGAIRNLESRYIRFAPGSTTMSDASFEELREVEPTIQSVSAKAAQANKVAWIEIVGHAEPTGPETANERLSLLRANAILSRLETDGFTTSNLVARGVGSRVEHGSGAPATLRASPGVSFHVELKDK